MTFDKEGRDKIPFFLRQKTHLKYFNDKYKYKKTQKLSKTSKT